MNCGACGHDSPVASRFCNACGAPLAAPPCAACSASNPLGSRFCRQCGTSLADAPRAIREPRAYTPQHLAEKILSSRAALEGERKQVTVLFVDVKGSMDLAEQLDPEEWARLMERFFAILTAAVGQRLHALCQPHRMPLGRVIHAEVVADLPDHDLAGVEPDGVHRFEGTVSQYTGDGIMALFGAPIAHEDHAQRACYAALHLRDALQAYGDELRVLRGLNFGFRLVCGGDRARECPFDRGP